MRDRAGYDLRNANSISLVKTKKVKVYNSFIPKTIRDWNSLDTLKNSPSLSAFKAKYKRDLLKTPNPHYLYEHGDANIHHTRLRLGLSNLKSHLFTYNLVQSPICGCGLESETTEHYILRCPTFGVARIQMYHTLLDIVDHSVLVNLKKDSDIVNLFLFGHSDLSHDKNELVFKMAQTYINQSERFSSSGLR